MLFPLPLPIPPKLAADEFVAPIVLTPPLPVNEVGISDEVLGLT